VLKKHLHFPKFLLNLNQSRLSGLTYLQCGAKLLLKPDFQPAHLILSPLFYQHLNEPLLKRPLPLSLLKYRMTKFPNSLNLCLLIQITLGNS
jgi:hypothetical protein